MRYPETVGKGKILFTCWLTLPRSAPLTKPVVGSAVDVFHCLLICPLAKVFAPKWKVGSRDGGEKFSGFSFVWLFDFFFFSSPGGGRLL